MDNVEERNSIKDVFITIFLVTLIFFRVINTDCNNSVVNSIGYIGVLIALFDLYIDVRKSYVRFDRFHVINGIAYVLVIPLTVLLVFFLTGTLVINTMWNDVFTLLALLISLPEKMYIRWLKKIMK